VTRAEAAAAEAAAAEAAEAPRLEAWLFGGGTALGAVQARPLRAFRHALGRPADLIGGCSVGSLTALLGAQDRVDRLIDLWCEVDGARWFQRLALDFNPLDGLFSLVPLRRHIAAEVAAVPVVAPLHIGIVDLQRKSYEAIRGDRLDADDLIDALIASCTQPGIHEETRYRGRLVADGGLRHVLPNPPEIDANPARWRVRAVLCTPADRGHPADGRICAASRGLECLIDGVVAADVARLHRWSAAGAEVWLYDPPEWPGDPFDADNGTIRTRLALGRVVLTRGRLLGGRREEENADAV
jgi:hypothetical protein